MKIEMIKDALADVIEGWANGVVDTMGASNPKVNVLKVYLKHGVHNYLHRQAEPLMRMVDDAALFIADEQGEVNLDRLADDVVQTLNSMEPMAFTFAGMRIDVGGGKIRLHLPDSGLGKVIFGEDMAVCIGEDDVRMVAKLLG